MNIYLRGVVHGVALCLSLYAMLFVSPWFALWFAVTGAWIGVITSGINKMNAALAQFLAARRPK